MRYKILLRKYYFLKMTCNLVVKVLIFTIQFVIIISGKSKRPNVVLIVADDLGWDDVSFHGSNQILTPNIDMLAYTGVPLQRYYSHCICTPSRSALLTSKFAHVTGMQGYPLTNGEDRGLPLKEKIMPQYFKELGYITRLVGKWHIGHSRSDYLPTSRGFDSHFGHRGGYIDYYEYILSENWSVGEVSGFDLYRNMTPAWDLAGYLTDLYTEEAKSIIKSHNENLPLFLMVAHNAPHCANEGAPLQAPPDQVRSMRHVQSPRRRIYAAMVKKLDDSIGDIFQALHEKGILENTIIAFISDNGGITSGSSVNYASNYPLRGLKLTPFEGGIRVNGLIWSRNLTQVNHVWKGYMHVVDWTPTLLRAVGAHSPVEVDGLDLWENLISNQESKRKVIFEIDDYTGFASIIYDGFKLHTGTVLKDYSNHQGKELRGTIGKLPSYTKAIERSTIHSIFDKMGINFNLSKINLRNEMKVQCNVNSSMDLCYPDNNKYCLYNIKLDPCETEDLSAMYPEIIAKLDCLLQEEIKRMVHRHVPLKRDLRAMPTLYNNTWTTWADGIISPM